MRPFRARFPEWNKGQIDKRPSMPARKNRLRRRADDLQPVAVDQESPAPESPTRPPGGALHGPRPYQTPESAGERKREPMGEE